MCDSIMQTSVGRGNAERVRKAEVTIKEKKMPDLPKPRELKPELDMVRVFSGLNLRG
jgi:hypothetical protein